MANINDYLLWRGDIKINKASPFNQIDSMVLARFSYLLFDKITLNKKETIESISNKMKDFPNNKFRYNGDKALITNLGVSDRFKNMLVTDFIQNTDKAIEKQFSAITVHISDKEMYLSFIGTDSSIVGWKEDFNLTFRDDIPAQHDALEYLNKISQKYPNKKIRLGGHSKGGNIAIYASIYSSKEIQNRIIKVDNYDGPGFDNNIIKSFKDTGILKKITTFIPQDSVIGRLLEHKEKVEIVYSLEKGIYQHDIYSWQLLGKELTHMPNVTASSELIYKTIRNWLKQTTPEQRKVFIDGLFEVFYSTSANTFGEFSSTWMKNIPTLFKTYKGISEEDRKTIIKMLKEFGKAYTLTLKENEIKKKKDNGKKAIILNKRSGSTK